MCQCVSNKIPLLRLSTCILRCICSTRLMQYTYYYPDNAIWVGHTAVARQEYAISIRQLTTSPLFSLTCRNANALAEAMGMGVDLDIYSKLLSNLCNEWGRNLPLIHWCIANEFKSAPVTQNGSLMRGNTFLSKLESEFARTSPSERRERGCFLLDQFLGAFIGKEGRCWARFPSYWM